ncbi:uncharacterized protein [Watersipora subatra]|uniref:uncharacterized protein n=1 Tax=Watersipora subatra TaxID=2589382 RepID=UPI00355BC3A7
MTKTTFGAGEEKGTAPEVPQDHTAVYLPAATDNQFEESATTCWYVFGVLSTIFCCMPCGVIGLVHAMIAKHEGERGNYAAHRTRLSQAKCWTSWSMAIGLALTIAFFTLMALSWYRYNSYYYYK